MVTNCCVTGCMKEFYPGCGVSFHKIPNNRALRLAWKKVIPAKLHPSSTVCSQHFKPEDLNISIHRSTLKPGVIPSIFPKTSNNPPQSTKRMGPISYNNNITELANPFEELTTDKDPLKLEDYTDDETYISSRTVHNAESSSTQTEEESLSVNKEQVGFDHDYERVIPPSILSREINKSCIDIALDHDYEDTSSNPLNPIATPDTTQEPLTFVISPLSSSNLTSGPASVTTHQETPTMVIGPLPSSHLQTTIPVLPALGNTIQEPRTMLIGPLPSSHLPSNQDNTALRIRVDTTDDVSDSSQNQKTIQDLRQQVKILQHRLRRRDMKIKCLNSKISSLKKRLTIESA